MLNNKKELSEFLESIKADIIKEQKAQGRVASGKSIEGYDVETSNVTGTLYGVSYSGTLETGRKGGKVPYGFAEIIEDWINEKRIFQDKSIAARGSIAYHIAKKIQEEGTKLHREGGQSGVFTNVITDKRLSDFSKEILTSFQNDTINEILYQFAA
jgi:hypothetical protein